MRSASFSVSAGVLLGLVALVGGGSLGCLHLIAHLLLELRSLLRLLHLGRGGRGAAGRGFCQATAGQGRGGEDAENDRVPGMRPGRGHRRGC